MASDLAVSTEQDHIAAILREVAYGTLAVNGADGWPLVRAVNFVHHHGCIYFHGAPEGEKIARLQADPRITFLVARELALIPSHFLGVPWVCMATQFYESVLIRGRARWVEDAEEKVRALQALVAKLQPEGQYDPLTTENDMYAQTLQVTGVVAIEVDQMTSRCKVGQHLIEEQRAGVMAGLEARGGPRDAATLAAIAAHPPG